MAFVFPHIEHKIYKNTCLQSVIVDITFPPLQREQLDDSYLSRFNAFLAKKFAITLNEFHPEKVLHIRNSTNKSVIALANGRVQVFLPHDGYVSFADSASPQIIKLLDYLQSVVSLNLLSCISIRKINVWQIKQTINDTDLKEEIVSKFFSPDLLSTDNQCRLSAEETKIPLLLKKEWNEKEATAIIRTAFIPIPDNSDLHNLILDTEVLIEPALGIEIEQVLQNFEMMNQKLFDMYHWAVNNEIISIMDKD